MLSAVRATVEAMRLTMIGGGGFRVPSMYQALAADPDGLIDELVLVDSDAQRLQVIADVVTGLGAATRSAASEADADADGAASEPGMTAPGPRVLTTTNLVEAVTGADVIFNAIRVGGIETRALDERIALDHGLLGQETVGVGGQAYALRTIPVARTIAGVIAAHAPDAWTINFTNPAGVITQAMRERLDDRVIGICDTPIGLVNRIADITGTEITGFDYVGLNHLGWLRGVRGADDADLLARVLADDALLTQLEEARLFGPDVVRSIGALPNEYLFYYWHTREAIARIAGRRTRGEQLVDQQGTFYEAATAEPERARELWQAALREREETYGAETREDPEARRSTHEIELGGYQKVALQLMRVLAGVDAPIQMILNVGNLRPDGGRCIEQLADDAVVEVACNVTPDGVQALPAAPLPDDLAGLMVQVKGCDELLLRAAEERDPMLALRAFATHPLVDSLDVARALLRAYCERIPSVGAAIGYA